MMREDAETTAARARGRLLGLRTAACVLLVGLLAIVQGARGAQGDDLTTSTAPQTLTASTELLSDAYVKAIRLAFAKLYNLDYEASRSAFERLRTENPGHPGPPLDVAIVVWQQELFRRNELSIERFASPSHFTVPTDAEMPIAERRAFRRYLEESKRLSEALLNEDPDHPDGLYYLGSALGVEASFAFTIERDKFKALGLGRDARDRHRRLVEIDATYVDAYLTLGMYQYLVDNLPWYVKWIASLVGFRGDEQLGLEYLESVASYGRRSQDVARVLRMVLLVREERFEDALAIARALKREFPKNYLFALNEIQLLEEMDRVEEAIGAYRVFLGKLDEEEPNYQLAPAPELRLRIAERLLDHGSLPAAETELRSVLESPNVSPSQRAISHLNLGRVRERQGRAREARRHFQRVFDLADSEELRDQARDGLERLE